MTSEQNIVNAVVSEEIGSNIGDYDDLHCPDECVAPDADDSVQIAGFEEETHSVVPFKTIFQSGAIKNVHSKIFLPQQLLEVKIIGHENNSANILNPNLYSIQVSHGGYQWTIHRRYNQFQNLHQSLLLLKASMNIPLPTKGHREQRASFRNEKIKSRNVVRPQTPRFPKRPEALISEENINQRIFELENYLKAVVSNDIYCRQYETLKFLEISRVSFVDQLGDKRKEGLLKKRNGEQRRTRLETFLDDVPGLCCCLFVFRSFTKLFEVWRSRWFFVKDTFVAYMRPHSGEICCVLLMDREFRVVTGAHLTGSKNGVFISNASRSLLVKDWTKRKAEEWTTAIQNVCDTTGKDFIEPNRFGSFAPVRESSQCTWFVDGCDYMASIASALESAKEEIMIADWWLSPEIHLKRPVVEGNKWRLDTVLHRKAEEGVRVFVLLYKEVELALGINSFYSKKQLCSKHPNVKVLRHPDHVSGGVLFWAHHEKLVVVDQSLAFLGGIDLCYGRWDDEQHRLTDLGSVRPTNTPTSMMSVVQASHNVGQQKPSALLHLAKAANNVSFGTVTNIGVSSPKDTGDVDSNCNNGKQLDTPPVKTKSRRATVANRMRTLRNRGREWAGELKEDSIEWMGKHFTKNWSGSEIDLSDFSSNHDNIEDDVLEQIMEDTIDNKEIDIDVIDRAIISQPIPALESNRTRGALKGFQGSTKLWIGKDYTNFIVKDFINLDEPLQDIVDRSTTPRMPWHDIGCAVTGKVARDVARHFIQRWNAVKVEKVKDNPKYPLLVPKSYQKFSPAYLVHDMPSTYAKCQVLRSSSSWSIGTRTTESSIHEAYIDAIQNSKHFIYIENQFFITIAGSSDEVTNRVGRCLYERVMRAHQAGQRFRVYVVMPLLPGFEGQIGTTTGTAIQAVTHWNYASICRGPNSLLGRLRDANIDPMNYISFYGLRTHSELKGQLVTELIYVHSKLMIVDDVLVICGSANINDRSLSGKRDSELALIIEDTNFEDSIMDGQPYRAGLYASSLRKHLFREHLGITERKVDIDINDPVADSFYKGVWIRIASLNTKIYEQVFRCIPSDSATSFTQLKAFQAQFPLAFMEPQASAQKLAQIQGFLVLLPLHFLSQEDLTPAAGTAEALMPTSLWT